MNAKTWPSSLLRAATIIAPVVWAILFPITLSRLIDLSDAGHPIGRSISFEASLPLSVAALVVGVMAWKRARGRLRGARTKPGADDRDRPGILRVASLILGLTVLGLIAVDLLLDLSETSSMWQSVVAFLPNQIVGLIVGILLCAAYPSRSRTHLLAADQ
jgi:hypothetical protein